MRMSRSGKRLELFAIEAGTGATRLLAYDERPATFVAALDFSTADWQWQVFRFPMTAAFSGCPSATVGVTYTTMATTAH